MTDKKTYVKPHKRSNPKSDGKHSVRGHTRRIGKKIKDGASRLIPGRNSRHDGGARNTNYEILDVERLHDRIEAYFEHQGIEFMLELREEEGDIKESLYYLTPGEETGWTPLGEPYYFEEELEYFGDEEIEEIIQQYINRSENFQKTVEHYSRGTGGSRNIKKGAWYRDTAFDEDFQVKEVRDDTVIVEYEESGRVEFGKDEWDDSIVKQR